MLIVGCDYHPRWQQVAWLDTETGETGEQKLVNGDGEAERWYRQLPVPSLIGLESTGNSQWFVDLLRQIGHEVWIGDAAQIRASHLHSLFLSQKYVPHGPRSVHSRKWQKPACTLRRGEWNPDRNW